MMRAMDGGTQMILLIHKLQVLVELLLVGGERRGHHMLVSGRGGIRIILRALSADM